MDLRTRAGVHDQVSPCSIESRDISAISSASSQPGQASVASSDMISDLGLDGGGRPRRQTRGCSRQELHQFLDAALELRIMAMQDLHGILLHHDVRIDAVAFDDPTAFRIGGAELWHIDDARRRATGRVP